VLTGISEGQVVRKNIPMEDATNQLIELIKEHGRWVDKEEEEVAQELQVA
jgi:(E)-4-hydroxy-3-methylbut-2-enyl-diphosphate synthase